MTGEDIEDVEKKFKQFRISGENRGHGSSGGSGGRGGRGGGSGGRGGGSGGRGGGSGGHGGRGGGRGGRGGSNAGENNKGHENRSRGHEDGRSGNRSVKESEKRGRGGRGGGRGGRGGGQEDSYGIVPWTRVNGKWYFLGQVSYSSKLYDIKVDPMRGKSEGNETPWKTACREVHEESAHVLDFSRVPEQDIEPMDGLFHVQVCFDSAEALCEVMVKYDNNKSESLHNESVQECAALVWLAVGDVEYKKIRMANQTYRMAECFRTRMEEQMSAMPLFQLTQVGEPGEAGASFVAEQVQDSGTMIDPDNELWRHSGFFNSGAEQREEFVWQRRKYQVQQWPDDLKRMRKTLLEKGVDEKELERRLE